MESADVVRIATDVLREYGVPFALVGVSVSTPLARWVVALTDLHTGSQRVAIDTCCDRDASPYHLRESLKAKLDVGD
jgi:hypothetical protein